MEKQVSETIAARGEVLESEYRVRTKQEEIVWVETKARLFYDATGEFNGAVYVQSDVTKRKLQEQQLQAALQEKDYLMKELNHRVKNNLAMVSALIGLKTSKSDADDLSDLQHQIDAIKLIHEQLYQSDRVSEIDCRAYLDKLIQSIVTSFATRFIRVEMDIEECRITPKTATTLGLIINELVMNAIKYGFSGTEEPVLKVTMRFDKESSRYTLRLLNTGNDFPDEVDLKDTGSMGLQLVSVLTEQLGGVVTLDKHPNPQYEIIFPADNN